MRWLCGREIERYLFDPVVGVGVGVGVGQRHVRKNGGCCLSGILFYGIRMFDSLKSEQSCVLELPGIG